LYAFLKFFKYDWIKSVISIQNLHFWIGDFGENLYIAYFFTKSNTEENQAEAVKSERCREGGPEKDNQHCVQGTAHLRHAANELPIPSFLPRDLRNHLFLYSAAFRRKLYATSGLE